MKSIAQFFHVEWGEYRGTLFGLWAVLALLILVAFFSSARPYVMDQTSPILFAGFGYLGFALAVLPRVFRPEFKDPQRGFLRRTPGGLNHSFLGKSLFVYTGMLLSALVPMATTFALLYILDPAGMEWLAFVQEDFAEVGMFVVAINALPLLLFAWGLSFRWMLLAVPVAVAMVYGACKLVMVTSYYSLAGSGVGPYMAIYMGLFTGPWLVAWYSYRAPKGRTQLKRWLYTTAVLGGGLGSAWGLGAVGTYKQIKQIHSFDPEDQEL
ncbi:MAG: hypothetical protein GY888_08230, partial [Planctomycetaceae bacterium]|nr:hypothetical protein [Planctomycetaceae bacterium]